MTNIIETIPTGTWTVDPAHSSVSFSVKHLMVSKVRGVFGKLNGTAKVEPGGVVNITATVDATSIDTKAPDRDAHLRGEDFFDTKNHPELTFVSTTVEPGKTDDTVLLHGNLTIRGVTKPVVFTVEIGGVAKDPYGNVKGAAEATTTISRSEFGLTWNTALESGGVLVGDEVKIVIEAQATLTN